MQSTPVYALRKNEKQNVNKRHFRADVDRPRLLRAVMPLGARCSEKHSALYLPAS